MFETTVWSDLDTEKGEVWWWNDSGVIQRSSCELKSTGGLQKSEKARNQIVPWSMYKQYNLYFGLSPKK